MRELYASFEISLFAVRTEIGESGHVAESPDADVGRPGSPSFVSVA
ncbi:MAG TPA: hypothetical protein VJA66_13540 [Thermoanaerobaculia bacterium]